MWVPCEPTRRGAVNISLQELDAQGLASKVHAGWETEIYMKVSDFELFQELLPS